MNSSLETVKELCKLASDTFHLSSFIVDPIGKILFESANNQMLNPLYSNEKINLFRSLNFEPDKKYNFPVIRKSHFFERYIIISIMENDIIQGSVLIGPSTPVTLSELNINILINDFQAFTKREQILNYYGAIPILQNQELINISIILFYMINKTLVASENILRSDVDLIQQIAEPIKSEISVSKTLETGLFHHDPLYEKEFLNMIKEGRFDQFESLNSALFENFEHVVLSKSSYIRTKKNIMISLITLASRAAIEGGLHSEIALTMSDDFIQRLEELNTINDIYSLAQEVLFKYSEKVSQTKNKCYSKTIIFCKNYIYSHLYEDLNREAIAKAVNLNPSYLSVLFKKEVGISMSEYIQQTKINESINLLTFTNTSIHQICSLLNFTDQSYFTKIFRKFTGTTPKDYRERYHL
ncbi:helix-turn-helix domain-containing protein [Clostridium sp. UBA1056]|uniref:helix-turn-helix domain-containing protein n=1 Tax=unclassified Clostridium TaxID=2614128 RepID=UPI0032170700